MRTEVNIYSHIKPLSKLVSLKIEGQYMILNKKTLNNKKSLQIVSAGQINKKV